MSSLRDHESHDQQQSYVGLPCPPLDEDFLKLWDMYVPDTVIDDLARFFNEETDEKGKLVLAIPAASSSVQYFGVGKRVQLHGKRSNNNVNKDSKTENGNVGIFPDRRKGKKPSRTKRMCVEDDDTGVLQLRPAVKMEVPAASSPLQSSAGNRDDQLQEKGSSKAKKDSETENGNDGIFPRRKVQKPSMKKRMRVEDDGGVLQRPTVKVSKFEESGEQTMEMAGKKKNSLPAQKRKGCRSSVRGRIMAKLKVRTTSF